MSIEERPTSADSVLKKSSRLDWIWPSIVGVIIVKLFGLAGGLVTIGAYCWLKPKLGTWGATTASGVLGVLVSVAIGLLLALGNTPPSSSEVLPIAPKHQAPTSSDVDITDQSGISVEVLGIHQDGKLITTVSNESNNWTIVGFNVSLFDAKQQVETMNGQRSSPPYSESYSVKVNVRPGGRERVEVHTVWKYERDFLVASKIVGVQK